MIFLLCLIHYLQGYFWCSPLPLSLCRLISQALLRLVVLPTPGSLAFINMFMFHSFHSVLSPPRPFIVFLGPIKQTCPQDPLPPPLLPTASPQDAAISHHALSPPPSVYSPLAKSARNDNPWSSPFSDNSRLHQPLRSHDLYIFLMAFLPCLHRVFMVWRCVYLG